MLPRLAFRSKLVALHRLTYMARIRKNGRSISSLAVAAIFCLLTTIGQGVDADLALTGVGLIPMNPTAREFQRVLMGTKNNGPADFSGALLREYYLSANPTFGDADDVKIGQTVGTLTLAAGTTVHSDILGTDLSFMVGTWPAAMPFGNYYLFIRMTSIDATFNDPVTTNNVVRSSSPIRYGGSDSVTLGPNDSDLEAISFSVLPLNPATRAFTSNSMVVRNNGPRDYTDPIPARYYLSANTIFGDADDVHIGGAGVVGGVITVAAGNVFFFQYSPGGLADMTSRWPATLPPGRYYLFAQFCALNDPNSANNVIRMDAPLEYGGANAPAITTQPANVTVLQGGTATFSVVAASVTPLTYQWRKDGVPLVGATNATLTIANVIAAHAGLYSVVISNASGSATSVVATLVLGTPLSITSQPTAQTVAVGANVTLRVGISGLAPFTFQWRKNGVSLPAGTSATLVLPGVSVADAGTYSVVVSDASRASLTSETAALTVGIALTVGVTPEFQSAALAGNTSFRADVTGSGPFTYQWNKDGRDIAGATNAILAISNVSDDDAGAYGVRVASPVGTGASRPATLEVVPPFSRIANMSVRTTAGSGSATLAVGLVIAGVGEKPVLVRGIGPSLSSFGVSGVVADPELSIYRDSIRIATNDNWGDAANATLLADIMRMTGAFPLAARSLDAAVYSILQSGAYTVELRGKTGSGVGLVEVYDSNPAFPARLTNVSARALVGPGASGLVVGFVVDGNSPKTVVVRAIGPTLAAFGVTGTLNDPQLVLNRGNAFVASNDDWSRGTSVTALEATFRAVGAFSLLPGGRDSAIVATLQPGAYTATVSGANGTTGVALVEVYEVP
jgi:hypothetical protein